MNTTSMVEIDPLSSYEAQYDNYPITNPHNYPHPPHPTIPYAYKHEESFYPPPIPYPITEPPINNVSAYESAPNELTNAEINDLKVEDVKPDITQKKRKRLPKGRTSSYWNKKITDKDFAFYGCSVCNIAYNDLHELDQHVLIHTNRLTSYDLRKQNLIKRKRLRREKKKQKKGKVKQELDVEIKPEDGYIGTEKTSEFTENGVKNDTSSLTDGNDTSENKMAAENNENNPVNNKNVENQNYVNVYKCFGCNKQFALSYYLKIHVRSHTDEKPYPCNICGQSFITASKRGRHNKRIHLNIRHQCRICYKLFSRFDLLVRHFDKKHAESKLEGEPYDYNTILPYLKELEDQLKLDNEKKPKTEDPWDQPTVDKTTDQATVVSEEELVMKEEESLLVLKDEDKVILPRNIEFVDESKGEIDLLPTDSIIVSEMKIDVDIKQETEETETGEQVMGDEQNKNGDDDGDVKREVDSGSDSEYFPSDTWVRSPSPPSSPPSPRAPKHPTTCDICNKKLSSKSYLRVHMRTHTGEKPFSCYICGRGFITASKMHRHVLTHDESWEGKDGIKPEGDEVKSETESVENEKPKKKSKVDKAKAKLLKKPKKTLEKKQKKYRKRPHVCEFCNQRFLHIETLQVHKKCHTGEALILKCRFCLEEVPDGPSLRDHEASHTGPKPYLCTLCGNTYTKRETMVYHRKNHKPSDEKSFVCDICSKRFKTQIKLQRHIISHSVRKWSLRYECPVCAHMFHTRYHVQMHLNTHMREGLILEENRNAVLAMVLQNARKIPKTPDPGATLPETIPADERSRICNICGQIFHHFFYLEEHLKTHGSKIAVEDFDKEEEKKYTCQVCSKSFKLHYYLKLHSYTHTKEKPFICQQCGKGFITKGKLKRHLETHQGLKKYQCHICYKFFTRPSYLRIHVRTIHGTQDYNFRDYGVGVPLGAMPNQS